MFIVSNISKTYPGAESPILSNISFTVNAGDRCGVVGANGAGKTTLIEIIIGQQTADKGTITWAPDVRVGYLAQGLVAPDTARIHDVLFPQAGELDTLNAEIERLSQAIADGDTDALNTYSAVLDQLATLGEAVDIPAGERALASVGLAHVDLSDAVGTLSGGQKTRLMLARAVIQSPDVLVLDEPTNHLDVDALSWLENWLADFRGAVLVVSHDRAFLDRLATHILAIDPLTHTGRHIVGNYSDYLELVDYEQAQQWAQWKDDQVTIARMKADVSRTMARSIRKENGTVNDFQRGRAKVLMQKAKAKETRLNKFIESDERVERPDRRWDVKIDFDELPRAYGDVITVERVTVGYDLTAPLLRDVSLTVQGNDRVVITGANGAGKTSLIRTILGEIPPLAGTVRIGGGVKVGYLAQEQDTLNPQRTALQTLRDAVTMSETDARSFLHYFLFSGDDPLRPVAQLSYGERARLMLALLVARGCNLLVMDEPLNHLDLTSREQFEAALANYPGSVLMIAHDRAFIDRFATRVWHLANGTLTVDYRDVGISH